MEGPGNKARRQEQQIVEGPGNKARRQEQQVVEGPGNKARRQEHKYTQQHSFFFFFFSYHLTWKLLWGCSFRARPKV